MAQKTGNLAVTALAGLIVAVLRLGRYLGLVGVIGLLLRLIGWYKSWIWTWVIFVIIGFISAAVLEKLQRKSQ